MSGGMIFQADLRQDSDPLGRFTDLWDDLEAALRRDVEDAQWLQTVQLCVMEAMSNAVRHTGVLPESPAEVRLEVEWRDDDRLELRVFDRGPGLTDFASRTALPDELLADGGRGIPLMHRLMDEAVYRVSEPENCLVLRCCRPPTRSG